MEDILKTYDPTLKTMKKDWAKRNGLSFNFKGVDKAVKRVVLQMFGHAHALWKQNNNILEEHGWLKTGTYLEIGHRYAIPASKYDEVANYIFKALDDNVDVNKRLFFYTQSDYRYNTSRDQHSRKFSGFDCSAFMVYLFKISGYWKNNSNPTTDNFDTVMASLGFKKVQKDITSKTCKYDKLRSGDIICSNSSGHIQTVVFTGTCSSDTYILESKTTPGMRFDWKTHKNGNNGYTSMCGPSISIGTDEVNGSISSVWRLTPEALARMEENSKVLFKVRITANALNIRKEPSKESPVVGYLHKGDIVNIYSVDSSNYWYEVRDEQIGWISSRYCERLEA